MRSLLLAIAVLLLVQGVGLLMGSAGPSSNLEERTLFAAAPNLPHLAGLNGND